ncbi:hypothetical protein NPIL_118691 [Nephila pilipes]|uniref:Uncharacterized protein n=1 Tax=Nephila pilipes TaxID=299642 RepID=A0A8X6U3W4_NEPPI|nr:hypothetical protein NPIL_118691 [Nephila pilipes]
MLKRRTAANNGSELLIFKSAENRYPIQNTYTNCQRSCLSVEFADHFASTQPMFVDETEAPSQNKLDRVNIKREYLLEKFESHSKLESLYFY